MDNNENLTAVGRDILLSGRAQLGVAMPYLSGPLCALVPAPGDTVTTSAATDGETLYYNAAFLAAGFMKSERFSPRLNLHMTLHCLFRHLAKRRGRDAVLWDLACDAAVESVIDSLPYACLSQRASPPKQQFLTECRRELKVLSAEGIYLTHEVSLGCSAYRGVTGHISDSVKRDSKESRFHTETCCRKGSLAACMACTDNGYIKMFRNIHLGAPFCFCIKL